jgi:hypothetical protein
MPAAAIAVPAATGLVGSLLQSSAQKRAANAAADAAAFRPYNVSSGYGSVQVGPNQSVSASLNPQAQLLQGLLGGNAANYFGGNTSSSGFQNFASGIGNGTLPGLFNDYLGASSQLPIGDYLSNQSALAGLAGQAGAYGDFMGLNALSNFGGASAALNGIPLDVSGLMSDRLNLLRQQAAPQEAQQLAGTRDTLFGQGRLGMGDNTIGGANPEMQALYNSFAQADLGRQLNAQNLGLQAQQQQANIGLGMASQYGNLGSSQMGMLQNLLGMAGNFGQQAYGNALGFNDLTNTRAQQRMSAAQGLFGFGQSLGQQDLNMGLSSLQGAQSFDQILGNLLNQSSTFGGRGASAGANQAQAIMSNSGSPVGAALTGLGSGLLQYGMNQYGSDLFKRPTPVNTNAQTNGTW